jgi:hypothetical protein
MRCNHRLQQNMHAGSLLPVQKIVDRAKVGALKCSHWHFHCYMYKQKRSHTCLLRSPGPGLTTLLLCGPDEPAVTATVLPTPMSGEPDRNSSSCATPDSWPGAGPAPEPCCCRSGVVKWGLCKPCCVWGQRGRCRGMRMWRECKSQARPFLQSTAHAC